MQLKHTFTAIFLFLAFSGSLFAVYPLCLYKNERRTNLPAAEPSRLANATQLNEKETDKAVSNSDINAECAYMSRLVEMRGVEPLSDGLRRGLSTSLVFFESEPAGEEYKRRRAEAPYSTRAVRGRNRGRSGMDDTVTVPCRREAGGDCLIRLSSERKRRSAYRFFSFGV